MWRQAVNRISVQLGASLLGGWGCFICFCFGGLRWGYSRGCMQHALDCLVSLCLVGTGLMEHASVYKTMGLYVGNTVLTGLAVNVFVVVVLRPQ